MQLTLSPDEAHELREMLASALSELRSEIHHTDSSAYRQALHARERTLRTLFERIGTPELVA
jgi:ElaB/YqjD/DUF883 family membrane-anchored ribosome-binding protein